MTPDVTLTRALSDPQLFGRVFSSPSFWTWRVIGKLIDGIPLTEPRECELFRECTGRRALPTGPVRRLILLAGRRAGKDRFASACAVWRAGLCADWRKHISAGEQAVVVLLGADRRQAAILRRYCEGLLETPLLRAEVVRATYDVVEFRNGASLEIATNDARLVRGRSAIAVLGSECCHWRTEEHAASSDEEVVGAAEPSMAMCPDGGLLLLGSSVHRRAGYMYRKFRELHGNEEAEDICWFAPSLVMNPKLRQAVIDAAMREDPHKAGAEYSGIWREDVRDFCPLDVIEACTDYDTYERPSEYGHYYIACCDAAGGTGSDSFTLAIAHRLPDKDGTVVLDLLRERKPRFVPADVVREFATLLKSYGISEVQGDKFAGGFHADEWTRNGIRFKPLDFSTSEAYLKALPMFLSKRAKLLNSSTLRHQLASLERHVSSGHEVIKHPQVASAHDDVATACCAALAVAGDRLAFDTSYEWFNGRPQGDDTDPNSAWRALRLQFYLESGGRTILW